METAVAAEAPIAGAESAVAPVSASQPEQKFSTTEPRTDTYASRMAEAMEAALNKQPEAEPSPVADNEGLTESESAPPQAPQEPQATEPAKEAPPADEEVPADFAPPDDIAANLKRINPEVRGKMRDAWFRSEAIKELGYKVDDLRFFKQAGFTTERAVQTLQRFPTPEAEARAIELASTAQQIFSDFTSSPQALLSNLAQLDQNAAKALVAEAASLADRIFPERNTANVASTLRNAIGVLKQRGEKLNNEDLKLAAEILEKDIFGDAQPQEPPVPEAIQRKLTEYEKRDAQLREQQAAFHAQQAQQFEGNVVGKASEDLVAHVRSLMDAANPSILTAEGRERVIRETAQAVYNDFVGNAVLRADVGRLIRSGRFDQQHGEAVVNFITSQAKKLAVPRFNETLRAYTKTLFSPGAAPAAPSSSHQQPAKPAAAAPVRRDPPAGAPAKPPSPAPVSVKSAIKGGGPDGYFAAMQAITGLR